MTLREQVPTERLRENSVPVITTERLVLRAPRVRDALAIADLADDRRIAENTERIPHPYRLADAEGWISRVNRRSGQRTFLVTLADGSVAGACGVEQRESGPEIGYWLGVPHWGYGYATEAVGALIEHAFTEFDFAGLAAGARVTNPASRRVLEKCGFQWTGVGLGRIHALGCSVPIDRFRLDRSRWAARGDRNGTLRAF